MISVENLSFSYGRCSIFENLSFTAADGECTVFAGKNGSGKSTALSVLAGILKPRTGSVQYDGKIGYIPQGAALLEDATVEENLRFFARITSCDIPAVLPFAIDQYRKRRVSRLSGGMKKQLSIACALLNDPQIIFLDEPCSALDIVFRDEMIEMVHQWKIQGKTIVYVAHDPEEFISFFDQLIFMDKHPTVVPRSAIPECVHMEEFHKYFKEKFLKESENTP